MIGSPTKTTLLPSSLLRNIDNLSEFKPPSSSEHNARGISEGPDLSPEERIRGTRAEVTVRRKTMRYNKLPIGTNISNDAYTVLLLQDTRLVFTSSPARYSKPALCHDRLYIYLCESRCQQNNLFIYLQDSGDANSAHERHGFTVSLLTAHFCLWTQPRRLKPDKTLFPDFLEYMKHVAICVSTGGEYKQKSRAHLACVVWENEQATEADSMSRFYLRFYIHHALHMHCTFRHYSDDWREWRLPSRQLMVFWTVSEHESWISHCMKHAVYSGHITLFPSQCAQCQVGWDPWDLYEIYDRLYFQKWNETVLQSRGTYVPRTWCWMLTDFHMQQSCS